MIVRYGQQKIIEAQVGFPDDVMHGCQRLLQRVLRIDSGHDWVRIGPRFQPLRNPLGRHLLIDKGGAVFLHALLADSIRLVKDRAIQALKKKVFRVAPGLPMSLSMKQIQRLKLG